MDAANREVAVDCVHFRGDVPCMPHKRFGAACTCEHYVPKGKRVCIIKLGAAGDVLRTTPLVRKLRAAYPRCEITWLTHYPELLEGTAERVLPYDAASLALLTGDRFDILYNLDKDREACALANAVNAGEKNGFVLRHGVCAPANKAAEHKYLTGIFDDASRANTLSYQQEIFSMAGFSFGGEKYILNAKKDSFGLPDGRIIGLNTGAGGRWKTRLWLDEEWITLASLLIEKGFQPLLLGGPHEHEKNALIAKRSGANYLGYFPLARFISLVNECEALVTGVTMAMHIGIALEKRIVLLNNIFNKNEFELYGLGAIVEPPVPCACFYRQTCIREKRCMEYLGARAVFDALMGVLHGLHPDK